MNAHATVLASLVLALAGMGDALLYVALPLHATTFGLSLTWVAVLLSANRLIRLVAYSRLARIAEIVGLRRFTIVVAVVGVLSTLMFAIGTGEGTLLVSRLMWGIAFGGLSLAALAYATTASAGAGIRVGLSYALRELGPIVALTAGTILLASFDARSTLAIVGATSMLAIPIATRLPTSSFEPDARLPLPGDRLRGISRPEVMAAAIGLVADGIFPATIVLLLARSASPGEAAAAAGMLIAIKRLAVIILGPLGGRAAEVAGESATTAGAITVAACGAFIMAWGSTVPGAILLISGGAIATTTIPLSVMRRGAGERLTAIARLGIARDGGAAVGPLLAIPLLGPVGAEVLFGAAGLLLMTTIGKLKN